MLNIEQTRALYQVRRADELPTVGAGATVSRAPVGSSVATAYAVGFAVSGYELDLFGRVHDLSQAALPQYFATAENRKAVQISLIVVGRDDLSERARRRRAPARDPPDARDARGRRA